MSFSGGAGNGAARFHRDWCRKTTRYGGPTRRQQQHRPDGEMGEARGLLYCKGHLGQGRPRYRSPHRRAIAANPRGRDRQDRRLFCRAWISKLARSDMDLSDGPDVNTGRISRDALRASISTYRPRQISMIADACLEARHFQSGTVPVLYDAPGPRRRVFVDNIFSTLPNDPSFFFRSKDAASEFCLFTSVLVDFLNGEDERAFRLANGIFPNVTTQTLYWNLPDAVLERGAGHGVNQEPRVEPGFPQGDDVYSSFAKPGVSIGPYPPGDDEHTSQPPEGGGPSDTVARRYLREFDSF